MKRMQTRFLGTATCLVMGCATALLACERNDAVEGSPETETRALEPASPVERTGEPSTNARTATGSASDTRNAVEQITAARCAREERCGNIGPDEEYATAAVCESTVRDEWRDDLNARECRGGVVLKEFSECLGAIREESCEAPFDTLERVAACRQSDICKSLAVR